MSNPSLEVQLGHVAGQQDMILRELTSAKEDRKTHYATIGEIKENVLGLTGRMTTVEETLTKFGPTIDEFIQIKQRVLVAGRLGKWLWLTLFALLGIAAKFRVEIMAWFGR